MAIDISNHLSSLLAEALEGGESGRAIFIKLLLTLEQSKPSEADKMMKDFLPLIPAADQDIITLVLDELQRAGEVELEPDTTH